jgi:hypothetical protein
MTQLLALFSAPLVSADPIRFIVGFILVCCLIAIVIILVKWLAGLAGVAIPGPLMLVLGILLFVVLLLWLLSYSGVYRF